MTTPESLSALLSQKGWAEGFSTKTAIVDEIHSFAEGKRGSFLALTLERLEAKALPLTRAEAFDIHPAVFIDNNASSRYTVVEVNARDRAALLSGLARALYQSRVAVHSAHIATYGERAVDVFYLTDLQGAKIDNPARLKALKARLLKAARYGEAERAAA